MSTAQETQTAPITQRAEYLYAGIWVVFLSVPVIAVWFSQADTHWRILSLVATVVFGAVYLWLAWRVFGSDQEATTVRLILGCSLLAGIAALSIPGIGPWVAAYTPYLAALVMYTRSPQIGIPIGVMIWAVPSVAAYMLSSEPTAWIIAGPGFGLLFTAVFRLIDFYDSRDRERAESWRAAEERDSMARDVHDVLGHALTVLTVKAQLARRLYDVDPDRAQQELADIERLSRDSLDQVRATVTGLRAPQLPGELDVARSTLETAGITPVIRAEGQNDGPALLAWALREAVTNVVRHSSATHCEIILEAGRLRVSDNGVGVGELSEGNGLRGLRERTRRAEASLVVKPAYPDTEETTASHPGTVIEVRL